MPARTLDELAQLLEQSAGESAKTNQLLKDEVMPRLDRIETASREAGILNGHAGDFKRMVEEYRQGMAQAQAWSVVRADVKHRLHWFTVPSGWLKMLGAALIGGLGWKLASTLPQLPPIHLP